MKVVGRIFRKWLVLTESSIWLMTRLDEARMSQIDPIYLPSTLICDTGCILFGTLLASHVSPQARTWLCHLALTPI
jgi:hypothetical protein